MFSRITALIAALALTVSFGTARPAVAEDFDAARTLAVIAGLAVLGKIISDRNDDRKAAQTVTRHQHIAPKPRHIEPRPLPKKAQRRLLPGNCLRSYDTRRGTVRMFPNRCLNRNYRDANRLPQHCAVRIQTPRGQRFGYEARCLRHNGYKLARN